MTNNYIDLTAVPFDNEAEEKFKKYKSQIDNLRNNRLITDEVALVTLSIIRTKYKWKNKNVLRKDVENICLKKIDHYQ